MTQKPLDSGAPDAELLTALRRLAEHTTVPAPDQKREAILLAAFDDAQRSGRTARAGYWWMAGLATAAVLLIAAGLIPSGAGRHGPPPASDQRMHPLQTDTRGVQPHVDAVGEFVVWPGSAGLPPLESGELVRVELPVSVLPTLGLIPPASHVTAVRADLLVGQDGLARAFRLVD
jgi:hypothetical protein